MGLKKPFILNVLFGLLVFCYSYRASEYRMIQSFHWLASLLKLVGQATVGKIKPQLYGK